MISSFACDLYCGITASAFLTSFLVIWSPSGDARGPSVVFEAVDMPCPGPFHFSHSVDYIYEFCPLPNPDVGPSVSDTGVRYSFCLFVIFFT